MARRGRKRANLPRYRNGQAKRPGCSERRLSPTPERIARRIELTGRPDLHEAWPLDVLKGRDAITDVQAAAGLRYALLYWSCYGPPASVGGHWRRIALGFAIFDTDLVGDDESRRRQFLMADAALADAGAISRRAVLRAAAHLEKPEGILALRRGLDALDSHFKADASGRGRKSEDVYANQVGEGPRS